MLDMAVGQMKRRCLYDELADLLIATKDGIRNSKYGMILRSGVQPKRGKKYLEMLLQQKLVETMEERTSNNFPMYRPTEKGKQFLRTYIVLREFLTEYSV